MSSYHDTIRARIASRPRPRRVRATMLPRVSHHPWAGDSAPFYVVEALLPACYGRTGRPVSWQWRGVASYWVADPS